MDFYKLTDFQLYSILHSRHLDKKSKAQAERELERRNLSEEEMQKLAEELEEKIKNTSSIFNISSNIVYLIAVTVVALFLLKQCAYQ